MSKFYRIGENLNVVTKVYGQAMKERNAKPLQEVALKEAEAGVDFIDVNIGPARKGGEELMAVDRQGHPGSSAQRASGPGHLQHCRHGSRTQGP